MLNKNDIRVKDKNPCKSEDGFHLYRRQKRDCFGEYSPVHFGYFKCEICGNERKMAVSQGTEKEHVGGGDHKIINKETNKKERIIYNDEWAKRLLEAKRVNRGMFKRL